jgi:hypothetical protein
MMRCMLLVLIQSATCIHSIMTWLCLPSGHSSVHALHGDLQSTLGVIQDTIAGVSMQRRIGGSRDGAQYPLVVMMHNKHTALDVLHAYVQLTTSTCMHTVFCYPLDMYRYTMCWPLVVHCIAGYVGMPYIFIAAPTP